MEQTLSIIKPDAVAKNVVGQILARFEAANLRIAATKKIRLSRVDAEAFYAIHAERPFFKDLVDFMISGPVVVTVLEGKDAMTKNRDLMGATNPEKQKLVRSELILLKALMPMQFTDLILWKMLQLRSISSLHKERSTNTV